MFLTEHTEFTEKLQKQASVAGIFFALTLKKYRPHFLSVIPVISSEASERVRKKSAFTLIELIITIAIAGIAILSLVTVFQEALKNMERQRGIQSANLLAEDLMNEIRSKEYVDPSTPVAAWETNRVNFDSVDDYNNWPGESPPMTIEGVLMGNVSNFTWRAIVTNVSAADFNTVTNNSDFKRITVIVSNSALAVSNMSVVGRYD
jgi:prepilin-type N-terminal cleavage/methylation domain-containing protein